MYPAAQVWPKLNRDKQSAITWMDKHASFLSAGRSASMKQLLARPDQQADYEQRAPSPATPELPSLQSSQINSQESDSHANALITDSEIRPAQAVSSTAPHEEHSLGKGQAVVPPKLVPALASTASKESSHLPPQAAGINSAGLVRPLLCSMPSSHVPEATLCCY